MTGRLSGEKFKTTLEPQSKTHSCVVVLAVSTIQGMNDIVAPSDYHWFERHSNKFWLFNTKWSITMHVRWRMQSNTVTSLISYIIPAVGNKNRCERRVSIIVHPTETVKPKVYTYSINKTLPWSEPVGLAPCKTCCLHTTVEVQVL